nr:protein FAM184A-like isoform X3 [Leptinotarsa decemlineata]
MSFVKNIFGMADNKETEDEEDVSEETSTSSDTGFVSSNVNSSSDLEGTLRTGEPTEADCSSISNFFGYWKNLINQEAKFQSQLNDLSKQLALRDAEASKLKFQMEELQRDVFAKSAGMDRLESELNAALKECETIRQRIRNLEHDLDNQKRINNQLNDELSQKSEIFSNFEKESKSKIAELEDTVRQLREKIEDLEKQLNTLKEEKAALERRHEELIAERDEEKRKVSEAVQQAQRQKQEIEKKWKEDFEKLRTINILKEQELLDDFEWKLREVQQTCKKRLEDKDKAVDERLQEAYKEAEKKMKAAEEMMEKLENLKVYENEVHQLRNLTLNQEKTMKNLLEQQAQMTQSEESLKNETKKLRNLIEVEKENLQHIQRLHHQEMLDKERKLNQTLNEKRTEIAMYWEERLMNECGRLKSELEQIHNEEKWMAMESVRQAKDEDFEKAQQDWEVKLRQCLKEVSSLKRLLAEKDEYYREELVRQQTATDQDILELRRLMDKIDMSHHDKYEKLVSEHDSEIDQQWDNLIHQKSEAIQLLEEEYVSKYKTLEEQFYTQQKSHSLREVELLKTIDSLKNELESKESTIEDLQNNVDTLEGGIQVLNQELALQSDETTKNGKEWDQKVRGLLETIAVLEEKHKKEMESYRLKFMSSQKQASETIEHLQKKCNCLTKLFEEVRQRYERRESRQEDLNKISDLKQIIAEQEKDLACINEEKRFFQMRLMALEKHIEDNASAEDEEFEDAHAQPIKQEQLLDYAGGVSVNPSFPQQNGPICIPPTIPEGDE